MFNSFIKNPVMSIVLSLMITILGGLALVQLPVSQFPEVAPPEVNVSAQYPGANAETVVKAVVRPLERVINGVEGMKYMTSTAGNDGTAIIQVKFESGIDPNMAAVNVQNRVSTVLGALPEEVRKNGIQVKKEVNSMLMYLNISSKDPSLDEKFLYNFAQINVFDELKRIKGVGFIDVMGQREYAIRVWLKPDRMTALKISSEEVINALEEQNIEAAPGQVGLSSDKVSNSLQYALRYPGKFTEEKQYEDIILRAYSDGRLIRLKDIADIELNTAFYDVKAKSDGKPCAAIVLKQLPGSNAQDVITRVKTKMEELKAEKFLPGMNYSISYDVSKFLEASINDVLKTFLEAFLLVSLVVFIFLQDFRSTLIPALAVPVSLIGTFFFMPVFGLSINLVTLFALVLAIGIVVDNAIVVVEAVHAKMEKTGFGPVKATIEAMKEITGAIIAITLVMSAVFIPVTFMGGPVGIFFRQFAITMAVSIVLSGVTALTLTPALCALLLKPANEHEKKPRNILSKGLQAFNNWYQGIEDKYKKIISIIANRRIITFGSLFIFSLITWGFSSVIPTGFIPNEDQGTLYATITTPRGATIERTEKVVDEVQKIAGSLEEVESVSSLSGVNILADGTGPIYGTLLINLKDWKEREASVDEIIEKMYDKSMDIKAAELEFFAPAAVPGYGNAGGFEMLLQDKTGTDDLNKMQEVTDNFIEKLKERPEIQSAFTIFDARFPQFMLEMDYEKAAQKGVTVNAAFSNLQTLIGSEYATNFIRFGKMFKVMVQAHPQYRTQPEDILNLFVKNNRGEMVPYSSFMKMEKVYGPEKIVRHNLYTSAPVSGDAAPGYSSGDVIKAIQEVAKESLPKGYGIDWSGITLDEVSTGGEGVYIFLISLLFVYLLLSAQYGSFLLPLPVILSLPVGVFGAFCFLYFLNLENNIYAQVALLMLIGILGKNAILIVEFANQIQKKSGATVLQAVIEASTLRLRPILMTSFAFTAGLIPLMLASGVGANGNQTIGSAAAGGMIFGTIFGVLIIPGLYVVFATVQNKKTAKKLEFERELAEASIHLN